MLRHVPFINIRKPRTTLKVRGTYSEFQQDPRVEQLQTGTHRHRLDAKPSYSVSAGTKTRILPRAVRDPSADVPKVDVDNVDIHEVVFNRPFRSPHPVRKSENKAKMATLTASPKYWSRDLDLDQPTLRALSQYTGIPSKHIIERMKSIVPSSSPTLPRHS